jgi:hypothetical protein
MGSVYIQSTYDRGRMVVVVVEILHQRKGMDVHAAAQDVQEK